MAGFGRTGTWFAADLYDVVPDLMTFAKGVNSSYVPLGGVAISGKIAETFAERPYPGGLTYSGHPLACAAAVATIDVMEEEGIVEHAARLGAEVVEPALRRLAERHPSVGDVRGVGMFWALEAGEEPGDPGAAGAVQRDRAGGHADVRVRRLRQGPRRVAVREHEPHPTSCRRATSPRRS